MSANHHRTAGRVHYRTRNRSKYNATRTTVDGITFASKAEARRYTELKALEAAGQIWDLDLQPKFELRAEGGGVVGVYRADFDYKEYDQPLGRPIVEDVKGMETPLFKWKWKHVQMQHPDIEFRKVK